MAKTRFAELLAQYIQDTVQNKFGQSPVDPATMRQIRQVVNEKVTSIFQRSSYKLSDVGLSWLTNQLFKRIRIGPDVAMADLIVINEHKLCELTTSDVQLLRDLCDQTDMLAELDAELKLRVS